MIGWQGLETFFGGAQVIRCIRKLQNCRIMFLESLDQEHHVLSIITGEITTSKTSVTLEFTKISLHI